MENLHLYQLNIINKLAFIKDARYTDLNSKHLSTNQFSYHLNYLLEHGYIFKNDDSKYNLTEKGKELAGRINLYTGEIQKQPKIIVLCLCRKLIDDKEKYLIHQRKRDPYYDYLSLPSGVPEYGKSIEESINKILEKRTGMKGKPELIEIRHVLVIPEIIYLKIK